MGPGWGQICSSFWGWIDLCVGVIKDRAAFALPVKGPNVKLGAEDNILASLAIEDT